MTRTQILHCPFRVRCQWWIAALATIGLLVGGGQTAGPLLAKDRPGPFVLPVLPADLDFVPPDGPGFVSFRVAELWQSEATKQWRQFVAKDVDQVLQHFKKALSLDPEDVERVTSILPAPRERGGAMLVSTLRPFDKAKVLQQLLPDAEKKELQGKTYYTKPSERQPRRSTALHFVNDRVFLIGPTQGVEKLLARDRRKTAEGPLSGALRLAAQQAGPLVARVNLAVFAKPLESGLPPKAKPLMPLLKAKRGIVTFVSGKETHVDCELVFPDEELSEAGQQAAKAALDSLRQSVAEGRKEMARDFPKILPRAHPQSFAKWWFQKGDLLLKQADEALAGAVVKREGLNLRVSLSSKAPAGTIVTAPLSWWLLSWGPEARQQAPAGKRPPPDDSEAPPPDDLEPRPRN